MCELASVTIFKETYFLIFMVWLVGLVLGFIALLAERWYYKRTTRNAVQVLEQPKKIARGAPNPGKLTVEKTMQNPLQILFRRQDEKKNSNKPKVAR